MVILTILIKRTRIMNTIQLEFAILKMLRGDDSHSEYNKYPHIMKSIPDWRKKDSHGCCND